MDLSSLSRGRAIAGALLLIVALCVPEAFAAHTLPKFKPDGLLLAYAGGGAGLFSAVIAGWANGTLGSTPVTREVRR